MIQLKASEIPRSSRIGRDNDKIADRGGISDPHITTHILPSIIQVLLARGNDQRVLPNSEPAGFYTSLLLWATTLPGLECVDPPTTNQMDG